MSNGSVRLLLSGASSIAIIAALSSAPAAAAPLTFGPGNVAPIVVSTDPDFITVIDAIVAADSAGVAFVTQNTVSVDASIDGLTFKDSTFLGDVINDGTLKGGTHGWVIFDSTISGDVTNNGTVQGGSGVFSDGLAIANSTITGNFVNTKNINGGTDADMEAVGLRIVNSTISGDIINSGSIEGGSAPNGADGVQLDDAKIGGAIRNGTSGFMLGGSAGDLTGNSVGLAIRNGSVVSEGIFNDGFMLGGTTGQNRDGLRIDDSTISGGINNTENGHISGGPKGHGISIFGDAVISGGITNDCIITGGTTSAILIADSVVSGAITNNGFIGGTRGIRLSDATINDGIVNNGSFLVTGTAIQIEGGTFSGGILNNSSIIGGNAARGISISESAVFSGGIANHGSIAGGENGGGILVDLATFSGGIHNFAGGSILGDGADAVHITVDASYAGGVLNEGRLDAIDADAIDVGTSNFTGTVSNAGLITSNQNGIRVTGFIAAGIFNSGTIEAPVAINIDGAAIGQTITQTGGKILGDVIFSGKGASYFVGTGGYFFGDMQGTFSDNDDITVMSGTWSAEGTGSGLGSILVSSGTGVFGGRFRGDLFGIGFGVEDTTDFGTIGGRAYIDDESNINVGDVTFGGEGSLEFLLTSNTAVHGKITAELLATLDGRLATYLDWNSFAGKGPTQDFSYLNVVQSTNDLSGAFINENDVDTNSVFFEATATQRDDRYVDIDVHRVGFDEIVPNPTGNQQAVGDALEEIYANGGAPFLALEDPDGDGLENPQEDSEGLYSALFQLATSGDVADAYGSLDGHINAAIFQTSFTIAALFDRNLQSRIEDVRDQQAGARSAGEPVRYAAATIVAVDSASGASRANSGWSAWTRAFGSWGNADGDALNEGFDQDSKGVGFGVDFTPGRNSLIGVSGQFASTDVEFDRPTWAPIGAGADIDSWQVALYGYHSFGMLFIDGNASATFNDNTTHRVDFWGQPIIADYDSTVYSVYGELGADLNSGRFNIQPYAGVGFRHAEFDNFTERCPLFCLAIAPDDAQSLYSALGVRASTTYRWGRTPITPELRFAWQHEFSDDRGSFDAAFAGAPDSPFHVEGQRFAEDKFIVGAGVSAEVSRNFVLFAEYNGSFSSDFDAHSISGGLRVTW